MGIDQLIGEEHFLHQGYGQHVIRLFIDLIRIDRRIDKVIVDPQINNQKAIACYEQATAYEGNPFAREAQEALYRLK